MSANWKDNSLLARQTEAIRQMLSLNQGGAQVSREFKCQLSSKSPVSDKMLRFQNVGGLAAAPNWKVLVYDGIGQSILAPIFSVKELREAGVTLHITLHSER